MVALPVLMEDLVRRACARDGSIDIVEPSVASVSEFMREPALHDLDVIITADGNRDGGTAPRALLELTPTARLLLIEQSGAEGVLMELRPSRTALGQVSPPELLRAIMDDAAHRAAWAALDSASWQRQD